MTTDRAQILLNGFNECMKHHTCGNYISTVRGVGYRMEVSE